VEVECSATCGKMQRILVVRFFWRSPVMAFLQNSFSSWIEAFVVFLGKVSTSLEVVTETLAIVDVCEEPAVGE
jgi:hypothetical protein